VGAAVRSEVFSVPSPSRRPHKCKLNAGNGALDIMIGVDEALSLETDDGDALEQIARVEMQIDELSDAAARCRKIRLISQIAIVAGGTWLVVTAIGVIGSDPIDLMAAISGVIGGIVMYGSNTTTWREVHAAMKNAEAARAALIGSQKAESGFRHA